MVRPGKRLGSPVHQGVQGLGNGRTWDEGALGACPWQALSAELRGLPAKESEHRMLSRGVPDPMSVNSRPSE